MAEQPNDNYARHDHNHDSAYAAKSHNHDTTYSKTSHNHDTVYSKLGHLHDERYSQTSHNHDSVYSKLNHVHDYATKDHNHDTTYSKLGHLHDDRYAPLSHVNDEDMHNGGATLYFGSHTGVHKAEATGNVTTTDPSKTVTVVKSNNTMAMQQTIDGVLVDLTDPVTTPPSQSGYVDIGALRIIYGITPVIPRAGSINQIVRIKLPQAVSTLLSVTTTIVMTGNNYDGVQLSLTTGPECAAQVLRVIDDYMYVYVDGHVSGINPEISISYNIFTTK